MAKLDLILGPMFAGKSSELMKRIRLLKVLNKEYLVKNNKTVLLVTHQVHLLCDCDLIVLLKEDGSLQSFTTFEDLDMEYAKVLLHVESFHDEECDGDNDHKDMTIQEPEEVNDASSQLSTLKKRYSISTDEEERRSELMSYDVILSFLYIGGLGLFIL